MQKIKEFIKDIYTKILAHIIIVLLYIVLIGAYQVFFDYLSRTLYFAIFLIGLGKVHGILVRFINNYLQKY